MSHEALEITIFDNLFSSICEQMGESLRRTARSVNIKDRLDFSTALFDARGELIAQAAHIPVHLGSMAFALKNILGHAPPGPDEMVLTNDPYRGGTHLPDLTMIAPLMNGKRVVGYVANRAHHADVGGGEGGSMAVASRLEDEGVVIAPVVVFRKAKLLEPPLAHFFSQVADPAERRADLMAQIAANRTGQRAFAELLQSSGAARTLERMQDLKDYARRAMEALVETLPAGPFHFVDYMDDDGMEGRDIPIQVAVSRHGKRMRIDFTGTSPQAPGNVNAVMPVTVAAAFYVFRCLLGDDIPSNAGCLEPLEVVAPEGTLVNARYPAAVAAGNVETAQRIVDALLGAMAQACPDLIPAASCGSMNNLSFRTATTAYYETVAGGLGGGPRGPGLDAVHSHMTNTRNTPVEALELGYPVRVTRYLLRQDSSGAGRHPGGEGVTREIEALEPMEVSFLTERRRRAPWGLAGGSPGGTGRNFVTRGGKVTPVPGKGTHHLEPGDRIAQETPGGGGWG